MTNPPPVTPLPPGPPPPPASARPPIPPSPDDQRYKDACQYAAGLSEKFLTISIAGIAFIIGLVYAKEDSAAVQIAPGILRAALVIFGFSVVVGWLFFMNIVGSLANDNDYRVHNNAKQWLCLIQIVTTLVAIALLAYCTFHATGKRSQARPNPIVDSHLIY